MAGIKIYNEETGKWDVVSSGDATGIRTSNPNLKDSKNVEAAITELSKRVDNLKDNVKWMYLNGTIGGGGNGGGTNAAKGVITLIGLPSNPYYVASTQSLSIQVMVQSKYPTNFTLVGQIDQNRPRNFGSIQPNRPITWDIGRLSKGTHTIFFTGADVDLIPIEPLTLTIVSGALEINSPFNDLNPFNVASNINIPYTVSSYTTDPVNVIWQVNNEPEVRLQNVPLDSIQYFNVGVRDVGSYTVKGYAYSNTITQSNVLSYTVNVGADDSIFLTVDSDIRDKGVTFARGIPISFPFRIINNKYTLFNVYWSIDGTDVTGEPKQGIQGINTIEINSDTLTDGDYVLRLSASDLGNITHTEDDLLIDVHITSTGFQEWQPFNDGSLLAHFVARGGNNSNTVWENKIKNAPINITCDLFGINNATNGFLASAGESDTSLVLNGSAYARINYSPFKSDYLPVTNGVTISVLYKIHNYGDKEARVIDCSQYTSNIENPILYKGLYINTQESFFKTADYSTNTLSVEDEWMSYTFVLEENFLYTYVNGILTSAIDHKINASGNTTGSQASMYFDSPIFLGCRGILTTDVNTGEVTTKLTNFADVSIKDVKIYNKALTSEQVVYNYVADDYYLHTVINPEDGSPMYDIQRQKDLRKINDFTDDGDFVIDTTNTANYPIVTIKANDVAGANLIQSKMDTINWNNTNDTIKFQEIPCTINYIDYKLNTQLVDRPGSIALQGTSSTGYTSKNWELYLGESNYDSNKPFLWTPRPTEWLPENRYTLKVNMMDSSHSNNVGVGRLLNTPYTTLDAQGNTVDIHYYRDPIPPKQVNDDNPSVIPGIPGGGHVIEKIKDAIDGFPVLVYFDLLQGEPIYMGVHTFNLGRGSFYNLGLKGIKFNESQLDKGELTGDYTELITGIYAGNRAMAYEIDTSDNDLAGSFKDSNPVWVDHEFTCRYPEAENQTTRNAIINLVSRTSKCGTPVPTYTPRNPPTDWTKIPTGQNTEQWPGVDTGWRDDHFVKNWNVSSLADYLILAYVLGMVDNLGKNLLLKTWNLEQGSVEKQWYTTFYDMDTILGLNNTGNLIHEPDIDIDAYPTGDYTVDHDNVNNWGKGDYNAGDSRLWERYRHWFFNLDENPDTPDIANYNNLCQAYYEKRKSGILSVENLMKHFSGVINSIGANYYNLDAKIKYLNGFDNGSGVVGYYNVMFLHGSREYYTKQWLTRRFRYLDSMFGVNFKSIKDNQLNDPIEFRFNSEGVVTERNFNITTTSPMFVKVSWTGQDTGSYSKKLVNSTTPTNFNQSFNANEQQTNMDSARHIVTFEGINNSKPSFINLKFAESLSELDLTGNRFIRSLNLTGCKSLRSLRIPNCTQLGLIEASGDIQTGIDVSNSKNLEYLDVSNTKIQGLSLPNGGVLKTLKCDNTLINTINITAQPFLEEIDLSNCTQLVSINLVNCPSLKKIILQNTGLNTFSAVACNALTDVDLSGSFALTSVSFEGAPNVTTLNISNCKNINFKRVNLQGAIGLKTLIMTGCSANILEFHNNGKSLATLQASNSLLQQTTFNNVPSVVPGTTTPALDFNGFTLLTDIYFNGCKNINAILNYKPTAQLYNRTSRFANCSNLTHITGKFKLNANCNSMFSGCTMFKLFNSTVNSDGSLVLPSDTQVFPLDIDWSAVTSLSSAFASCINITLDHMYAVLRRAINNVSLTSTFQFSGITTNNVQPLPENIFEKQVKVTSINNILFGTRMGGPLLSGLLAPLINLTTATEAFRGHSYNNFPEELLFFNNKLSSANSMFWTSTGSFKDMPVPASDNSLLIGLKSLTNGSQMFLGSGLRVRLNNDNLFRYNGKLTDAANMFSGCDVIGELHPNLFGGVESTRETEEGGKTVVLSFPIGLTSLINTFSGSANLTGKIDVALFANLINLNSVSGLFANTGVGNIPSEGSNSIPKDLFLNNSKLTSVSYLFQGTNLTGAVPDTLLYNTPNITSTAGMFMNCSGVSQLPNKFFLKTPNVTDISSMFENCIGLSGVIPTGFFDSTNSTTNQPGSFNVTNASRFFYKCYKLNSNIPEDLFSNTPNITNLDNFFYDCGRVQPHTEVDNGIRGVVPPNLFKGLGQLTSAINFFYRCTEIKPYLMDKENPTDPDRFVFLHPDFFSDCKSLQNLSGFFYDSGLRGAEIPVGLFDPLTNLTNISNIFFDCMSGNMVLDDLLFNFNKKLQNISGMCTNESASTAPSTAWTGTLSSGLFDRTRHPAITNVTNAFSKNKSLKGNAIPFWTWSNPPSGTSCYFSDTTLSNYSDIPANWK